MTLDMTRGKPVRLLIQFALPLMFSSLLQQFYTMFDSMIVGRLLGTEAFAAIGSASYLHWFPLSMLLGATNGFGVALSQRFGAKDKDGFKRFLANALGLTMLIGLVFTATGVGLLHVLLGVISTPPELTEYTFRYMRVLWLGLLNVTEGEILFQGKPRDISTRKKKKEYWQGIQAIFQDPFSSFNVFNKIDTVLLDCINMRGGKHLPKKKKIEMMTEACSFVNLKYAELTNKYPFELSGGQMQRLMIARIFLLKPKILLADEPTSMIDACSRATILDMLLQLRDEIGMTIIFITHDIGLAYYISDSVYIMEHDRFVESGSADDVILNPQAAYTKRLISDVPKIHEPWDLSTVG